VYIHILNFPFSVGGPSWDYVVEFGHCSLGLLGFPRNRYKLFVLHIMFLPKKRWNIQIRIFILCFPLSSSLLPLFCCKCSCCWYFILCCRSPSQRCCCLLEDPLCLDVEHPRLCGLLLHTLYIQTHVYDSSFNTSTL
jgi:hypothetical protein